MTRVKCLNCGYVINITEKVDKMISIKTSNPKVSFHPSYYNQCPNCGYNEVEMLEDTENTREKEFQGSKYRMYCPTCGQYTYFNYNTKGIRKEDNPLTHVSNPFTEIKCKYCGSKQGIILENTGEKYE